MFKIGDFSRIARVSCRLLRYYDELGLLKPASVADSSYRLYSASQLPRLNRILVLRELGLSLEQIGRVIDEEVSTQQLRDMLLARRAEVEQALAAEAQRLRAIEARIAQIDAAESLADHDVLIREEPAHTALLTRATVSSFAQARELIRTLAASVGPRLPQAVRGPMLGIAHSLQFEPDAIDIELGYTLTAPWDAPPALAGMALEVRELPSVPHMAVCVRIGLPEHAHLVTAKIGQFIERHGYALAGPSREVFLQPPQLERMEQSVVEMQFPVTRHGVDAPGKQSARAVS